MFCFYKGEPLITVGPHWPMILFTNFLLGSFGLFLARVIAPERSQAQFFIYSSIIVTIVTLFLFTLTSLKNPGILSPNYN